MKSDAIPRPYLARVDPRDTKMNNFEELKNEAIRQQNRTGINTLSPSQLGEIVWLYRSGYSTEATASRLNVKTWDIDSYINSVGRTK